jgi:putative hydrolase of the HAD superfamily
MDNRIFAPFFNHLTQKLATSFDQKTIDNLINDLWERPFYVVINKYNIPFATIKDSISILETLEINLNISTFDDYSFIKNLNARRFLVTTGLTALQKAKIKALKIENDFDEIIINDPFKEAKTKRDIFYHLKIKYGLSNNTTFVVGDNPESEIKAGNSLDFTTIQILRENIIKGDNARHYINSFVDLDVIIN